MVTEIACVFESLRNWRLDWSFTFAWTPEVLYPAQVSNFQILLELVINTYVMIFDGLFLTSLFKAR